MVQLSLLCMLSLGAVPSSFPGWRLEPGPTSAGRKAEPRTSVLPWTAIGQKTTGSQLGDFELLHRSPNPPDSRRIRR